MLQSCIHEPNLLWSPPISSQAWYLGGSKEEQAEASCSQWPIHVLSLPWKLLFALTPPCYLAGGWLTFVVALLFIALLTALVGELAEFFGCVIGILCLGLSAGVSMIRVACSGPPALDKKKKQLHPPPPPRGALEGKGPQRRPQKRLGRRLEEVAKAVGGGCCRLQMLLKLAPALRGTVAGHRLGALEGGGGASQHHKTASREFPNTCTQGGRRWQWQQELW